MKIIAAIHGILTGQTDPSWADHLDAWLLARTERDSRQSGSSGAPVAPRTKLIKKEYQAGPWPRWNCWVRNPRLARGLVAEIELLVAAAERAQTAPSPDVAAHEGAPANAISETFDPPAIWFVAHSNGAVIALEATKRLIARGHWVAGVILTGAACEGDLAKTPLPLWVGRGRLGTAIAYCSKQDRLLPPVAATASLNTRNHPRDRSLLASLGAAFWRWLLWPYGSLGRSGWITRGKPVPDSPFFRTRWFDCGHSGYFEPSQREKTFELIYQDIITNPFVGIRRG